MALTLNKVSRDAMIQVFGEEINQIMIKAGEKISNLRFGFQTTIKAAKMNLPFETIVVLVGIDTETCSLYLNKYKELGENVYEWFENEYLKNYPIIEMPKYLYLIFILLT